jgi:DNA-binding transcriptional MerR regulator
MSASYSIGQLANEFGVTPRTIRHYEQQGLLHPHRVGSVRIFGGRDRARLKLALRAKRLGFALHEIRALFDLYDAGQREKRELDGFLARIERHRALLERQREDIEVMLAEIDFFAQQCRKRHPGGDPATDGVA